MAKIAFLGTGLIGAGLAEAAARRGDEVSAWNRTRAKAKPLAAFGVRVFDSPSDAVRGAERVHVALTDDAAVDATIAACESALGAAVIVDHSTASPKGTAARAARLEKRGIAYLHCPVFMSPEMCKNAAGIMLAAGPKPLFERVAPSLQTMTGLVEYLGERRDLAAAYKLFGNAMLFAVVAGLADVLALARSLGVPPTDAHALFGKFNVANVIAGRGGAMARGDFRAAFELTMARKDAGLMLDAAEGATLAILPAIASRMDALIAGGHGHEDVGALASPR
jgi:3-hydroxyisobutyrate dehydrogenase